MAITKTNLGQHSASFTFDATETPASIMAQLATYISEHGWEIFDSGTFNLGMTGANPFSYVFRTLQDGSTDVYKYVAIGMTSTLIVIKIFQSWNATTHVGTNDGTYYNYSSSSTLALFGGIASGLGTDGNSIIIFANQKWLAFRTKSNVNAYGHMFGSFEIKKEFGEAPNVQTNIFMTTAVPVYAPSGGYLGLYGSVASITRGASSIQIFNGYNTISTPFGTLCNSNSSSGNIGYSSILPTTFQGACSMIASELSSSYGGSQTAAIRGRIMGIKLGYGSTTWNDMDTATIKSDSEFFDTAADGTPTTYHIINMNVSGGGGSFVRHLIPA